MATLPLDVRPANPNAHQFATTAPAALAPANDNARRWMDHPRAVRLLASCVARPPEGRWVRDRFNDESDEWWTYVGYRFEALTAIYDAIGTGLLIDYQNRGEEAYPAFSAWCRQPKPSAAIDAALTVSGREG